MCLLGEEREVDRIGQPCVQQLDCDSLGIGLKVVPCLMHVTWFPHVDGNACLTWCPFSLQAKLGAITAQ